MHCKRIGHGYTQSMATTELVMPERKQKERQIVVRMSADLADRIEEYGERLREEQPGPKWTMSDVVRKLLTDALATQKPRGKR